jgi:hypothetical protein
MNLNQAIKNLLDLLNESYQGKFKLTPLTPVIWTKMLRDIDTELILAAGYHLVSTRPDWPPDVPTIRNTAITLGGGVLKPDTGLDGWERVLRAIQGEEGILTVIDKKALAQTKPIVDLKTSATITADRATFIKAWDHLAEKVRLHKVALPEVRALVERNAPALPAPVEVQQIEDGGGDYPTQEEVRGYMNQLPGGFREAMEK